MQSVFWAAKCSFIFCMWCTDYSFTLKFHVCCLGFGPKDYHVLQPRSGQHGQIMFTNSDVNPCECTPADTAARCWFSSIKTFVFVLFILSYLAFLIVITLGTQPFITTRVSLFGTLVTETEVSKLPLAPRLCILSVTSQLQIVTEKFSVKRFLRMDEFNDNFVDRLFITAVNLFSKKTAFH